MDKRLVIIPTYKEKENIENIIRAIFGIIDVHILIIDDNSPDGTADIVKGLMPEFEGRLFIEERAGKLGLGTAYIHGFKWGLERNYDFFFEMDAGRVYTNISIDQIEQGKGYTEDNVQLVCMAVNQLKSDWDMNTVKYICKMVIDNYEYLIGLIYQF